MSTSTQSLSANGVYYNTGIAYGIKKTSLRQWYLFYMISEPFVWSLHARERRQECLLLLQLTVNRNLLNIGKCHHTKWNATSIYTHFLYDKKIVRQAVRSVKATNKGLELNLNLSTNSETIINYFILSSHKYLLSLHLMSDSEKLKLKCCLWEWKSLLIEAHLLLSCYVQFTDNCQLIFTNVSPQNIQ